MLVTGGEDQHTYIHTWYISNLLTLEDLAHISLLLSLSTKPDTYQIFVAQTYLNMQQLKKAYLSSIKNKSLFVKEKQDWRRGILSIHASPQNLKHNNQ